MSWQGCFFLLWHRLRNFRRSTATSARNSRHPSQPGSMKEANLQNKIPSAANPSQDPESRSSNGEPAAYRNQDNMKGAMNAAISAPATHLSESGSMEGDNIRPHGPHLSRLRIDPHFISPSSKTELDFNKPQHSCADRNVLQFLGLLAKPQCRRSSASRLTKTAGLATDVST